MCLITQMSLQVVDIIFQPVLYCMCCSSSVCCCTGASLCHTSAFQQSRVAHCTHILKVLSHVQEVQLYTADADQQAMTMGLRTHALGPTQTSPTLKRPSSSKVSIKEESDSQGQSRQPCLASHTHCSASSLEDVTAAPDAATVTRLACKMHEVTADSEEVKRGSGEPGGGSPQSSNPVSVASLGPCRMSSTQRYQSGELQTVSAGQ